MNRRPDHGAASREPIAWVLNLDAEHELEARGRYAPTRHVIRIVERERQRLIGTLVRPGDVLLDDESTSSAAGRGMRGVAWSPTPTALARLAARGACPDAAPPLDVLRRVNARPFAAAVREPLAPDGLLKQVALTLEEALGILARPAPLGWLVRREFGAAGRGRRRFHVGRPGAPELAWLRASLRLGPLLIEPWVEITREYTRSGFVLPNGEVVVMHPCLQETTAAGAWRRTEAAARDEVDRADDARLEEAAARAGAALAQQGYFGPFGIDAFTHRRLDGRGEVLNPMSEINARLTMDWPTGMGRRGDELLSSAVREERV